MASGIINWIIGKYLNNILEINKELTKSSLLTGEIIMENLKIKPEIFTLLNLPFFELVHGYLGKLRVKVKMPRVHLHPIRIEIENVFFHAKQKKLSNIKKEEEIKFMESYKNDSLNILEEFKNQLFNFKDDLNPNLLSKLINNIEINISNICMRFDDEISYSLTPFCFGVLIKNVKLKTVDKEFKEVDSKYSLPFEEINNKIIKVDNFSIFLDTFENEGKLLVYNKKIKDTQNTFINDEKFKTFLGPMLDYYRYCLSEIYEHINDISAHNYILFNLGFLFKISINENMKNGKPKLAVNTKMPDLKIDLSLVQLKTIMKLSIYQMLMLKYQSGLSVEYYNKVLTEKEKMEYIDNYIIYYNFMYGKKPNEKKGKKMREVLGKVEERLKYEEIQIMRNAAESKMSHNNEIEDIDKQLKEANKNKGAIFKRLSFKKKNKEEEELKEKEKKKQIEELEQKKIQIQEKVSEMVKERLAHIELLSGLLPDASGDFSLLTANIEMPEIQLNIKRNQEENLFSLNSDKLVIFGDLKNRKQNIKLTINDMSLIQYQLHDSKYQMIMTTVEQKNEKFSKEEKEEINACEIELENNPEFPKSNIKLKFRNQKRIILIANLYSLQYIVKKFQDYMTFFNDQNFDFPEKYNCSEEITKFIRDGFKYDALNVGFQHLNADLDVTIKSPIVLFPIDILDNYNKKCILIRCGDLHVNSELPPRQDKNINYAELKDRDKLIDTYKLKSEKLCVTTLDNFDGDLSSLLYAQGLNLIEDVSFDLNVYLMFEHKNPYFEKFRVDMNVGKCRVNVRDVQLPFFMELIEKNGTLMKLVMYKLEEKTLFEKKEIKFNKEEEEAYNINNKKKKENENILGNKENIENKENNIVNEDKKDKNKEILEISKEINNINNINNEKEENEVNEYNLNTILKNENNDNQKEEKKSEEKEEAQIYEKIEEEGKKNGEIEDETKQDDKNEDKKEEKKEENIYEINTSSQNDKKEEQKNNNNNELIVKKEEVKQDTKLLIVNFFLEDFQFCLQKTITYGEKQLLLKTKDEFLKNLVYRDFIIFDMNTFKINFLLTEKFNANGTLLIKSIGVIDKETLITDKNNPEGDLYIDKEFQHIIKMESGDNNIEVDRASSFTSYKMSSEYTNSIAVNEKNELNNNEINEDNKIKKNSYNEYFMVLKFNHNNETQIEDVDILLKKIRVCIAMNTMTRIIQFSLYYLEMFNKINEKNLIIWENMEMEHKKEKLKKKIIRKLSKKNILSKTNNNDLNNNDDNDDEDDNNDDNSDLDENNENETDDNNKLFDSKFASKLGQDIKNKENEEDLLIIDTNSKKIQDNNENDLNLNSDSSNLNDIDKEAEQNLKDKEIKLSKIFRTKNMKLNLKVKLELRETSILFPFDDTKQMTKILRVKANLNGNVHLKTDIDLIRNGNEKLVKVNFNENSFKLGLKVLNVEFGILNYENGIYCIDNICDRILSGFRLCLNINSILLLPEKERSLTMTNIDLEPLVFNIGFTQITSFVKFLPVINEFLAEIKKEYDDPVKEMEDYRDIDEDINYNINNIKNENENDENNINNINKNEEIGHLNFISTSVKVKELLENNNLDEIKKNEEILKFEENKKFEEEKQRNEILKFEKYKMRRKTRKKKKKKKKTKKDKDDKPEINILGLNNTIDVKINLEKALIKIIDDSGYYLQPLLNIEFREHPMKFIINTNSDSVHNISNLLVESISRKEMSLYDYDIKNLALYGEIGFDFSITIYNNRIEDWEPIIEKYGASITIDQVAWFSRLRILYNSNDMFNLNISFSILSMVNDLLKKILVEGEKVQKLTDVATNTDDKIAIEFINLCGIDISCWLDAEDTEVNNKDVSTNYKFNLNYDINDKKHKKKIRKDKLSKIYGKLTDAQLKIKKDKFSFKVQGFLPVTSNDFSSNYNTCFKLKKDLKDKYIDKNLNIDMEIENKGMTEKNDNDDIELFGEDNKLLLLKEKLLPSSDDDSPTSKSEAILINEDSIEEEIEIFIKIRKNGSLKSIVFESNIFFYNNLQIPISLSLVSQRDFNTIYNSNDNIIKHEDNIDKIVINSGIKKSLSLKYLIKKYRIYISFYNKSNKENYNYSLLYENFGRLKHNYNNFIKYIQENEPTYKGRKETKLEDYYSKLVSISHKNNNYYICSSLIIQRGSNEIINDIDLNDLKAKKSSKSIHIELDTSINLKKPSNIKKDDNDEITNQENIIEEEDDENLLNEIYYTKAFSYLFVLNESLVIENQLPFNIKCEIEGKAKKEVSIRPLHNKYFLDVNQDNTRIKLILKYQKRIFLSNFLDIRTIGKVENKNREDQNNDNKNNDDIETTIKLFESNNDIIDTNKFIECNLKIEENIENDKLIGAYEKEFEHNVKSFSKKRKLIIYNKCIIINKTDFLLYIRPDDIKRQNFDIQNYNGKLFQNSINILNTKDVKHTFKLKSDNSDWSDKFNINTIGHIGVISLELNDENTNNVTILEIGVSISSSWNFPNSLFITIEPRFLLINKFGYDIQYKQYNNKKDRISNDHGVNFQSRILKSGEELKLNLLKGSKNMKKMIQIKLREYSVDYSCPFDLDEIGDIDLKVPINAEMKQKLIKKNIEIEKKIEKLKKKERLKKKLQIIEDKTKDQEKKIHEENKDNINNINEKDDNNINIINTKNKDEDEINTNKNSENNNNDIITTNENNENNNEIKHLSSSNLEVININNIINKNIENNLNQINNQNEKIYDLIENSESERSSTIDDDEMSTDSFSFAKKSEKFLTRKDGRKELTPIQERLKKIEERNKKLEEVKMRPRKYYLFNQNNEPYLLIRVTKSIYKGLIYIVIFPPEEPQYLIKNQTGLPISLRQKKDSFYRENIILEKGGIIPYAWGDTLINQKLLYVSIDNNDVEINLNEIKVTTKRLKINEQLLQNSKNNHIENNRIRLTFFFQTIIEKNRTRTLIIKGTNQKEQNQISFLERIKEQKKNSFNIKLKLYTKGLGISIINNEPRELFYISFYGFLIETQLFSFNKEQCSHIIANVKLSLKNFQIDYCLKDLFKSMIIPKNQITPQIEELNLDNNNNMNVNSLVPLFQGIISFHRITNHLISVSSDEFPQLDFTMQPLKVNVSNYQLMSLLDLGLQLKEEFDFYLKEPEKNKNFDNIEDFEKFLLEDANNKDVPEYDPDHYDPLLNSKLLILPEEIIFNSEKHYMFFVKNIAIGSIVIILTTRIDLNSLRVIPTIVSGLSSFIGNIFTHITDYNLYLPSLYYTDVFTDILTLGSQLTNSYISQLKRRIFKILGSLDILGNPTGYASSIGQGFLEIFEAPRRGLIHGPLGFGEGVAKGFGTFITTLISSSFDIVGKISGTLLASCEELQGIKNTEYLSEREPSNIFTGLYYGVKNGIMDIGKGFAGIFIKPYQEAKKSGVGGFFQGVGAGLLGAAVSPVTAGLRIANNLIVGIKNTALIFNPKLKTERFRYPRTIQKAIRLNSYDEDEALVRAVLDYLGGYEEQEIIYFKQFKYINPGLQSSFSTLILTNKFVMIVYQAKELVFELGLNSIIRVEVHKEPNNNNIDLIFYLRNNSRRYIRTNDLSLCVNFYLMFENVKE